MDRAGSEGGQSGPDQLRSAGHDLLRLMADLTQLLSFSRCQALQPEIVHPAALIRGQGMSEDVLARVFEPFFTTKEVGQGRGLGLSMVYGFIKQSRGTVSLESHLGKGTVVRILLPAA